VKESDGIPISERAAKFIRILHRLLVVNLVCFLALLPTLSWFYLLIMHAVGSVGILPGLGFFAGLLFRLPTVLFYVLLVLSAVVSGPFLLGVHAVAGRIVMGRHVWVSDFFTETRRNVRQGVALGLFCVVVGHLGVWNLLGELIYQVPWVLLVSRVGSIILLLAFGLALPYVCQVAVSMEQPLWTVVKNGMILARLRPVRSLLLFVGVLLYWSVSLITVPVLALVGLPLFSVGLMVWAQAAVCRPVVERYLVEPVRRAQNDNKT